jgi:hypothetical protein
MIWRTRQSFSNSHKLERSDKKKIDEKLKAIGQAPINAMWPSETMRSVVIRRPAR